jgi:Enoyl-CoA hydratase/carnithine racemase
VATSPARTDRWKALDFGPPTSDAEEPDLPVLVEYTQDERVAVITLNRPHADNAITTAMGARLTEILETIAVRLLSAPSSSPEPASGRSQSAATSASVGT